MKKLSAITIPLILVFMLQILVGVSAGAATKSSTKAEPYTIKMAIMVQTVPKDMNLVADAINNLPEVKALNVKVEPLCISIGSWLQQMTLMLASGEKLDLRPVFSWDSELNSDVAKGQLLSIDDLLKKYGTGITKVLGPTYSNSVRINGKLYGVPNLRDMASGYAVTLRKDLVEKYKIDISKIKTYNDLTPIFAKVAAGEPGMIMTMNEAGGNSNGMVDSACGFFDDLGDKLGVLMNSSKDNKIVDLYEQPEYKNYLKIFRDWYVKGYTMKSIATNQDYAVTVMKSGKLFSFLSSYKPGFETQSARSAGMPVICVPLQQPLSTTSRVDSVVWSIPVNCKDPVSTMKFLNLTYTSPAINNLLSWGIEGKHYIHTNTKNIIDFPSGVTATTSGYNMNMGWEFGNQLSSYIWKGDSSDLYVKLAAFNKSATVSKACGFIFDNSSVKNEIAACINVISQYNSAIGSGCVDYTTELPKFVAALKSAGLNKIIAAKQTQFDKWLKLKK